MLSTNCCGMLSYCRQAIASWPRFLTYSSNSFTITDRPEGSGFSRRYMLCRSENANLKNNFLKRKITDIFFENKQRYGATKIYHVLLKENISVSLRHVQKLMRQLSLRSITIRKYKPQSIIIRKNDPIHYIQNST